MKNYFFYSLLFLAVVVTGCKEEDEDCCDVSNPDCSNYDPCWDAMPSADFKMRGTSVGFPVSENLLAEWCDTIFNSGVEFMADMEDAEVYEWYIGTETEPRFGRSFKLDFGDYIEDTLQNLNPDNPDYFLPLDITLIVRSNEGACVSSSDTVLTSTSQLVITRKLLTRGTFIGRVEGEDFDREVIFWQNGEDLTAPIEPLQYFSDVIGFSEDTMRIYGAYFITFDALASFKRRKWEESFNGWWIGTDGIQVWDQEIITSSEGPDRVELYFERYPEGSSTLEITRFSGTRVE
ncbi:MAG: hypothetical protein ACJAQ4_002258 [Cryomorphaceae bacterium]|jgi:hypothetical protein